MNKQILKVLHYIEINLDENLDIDNLSKIAGYSPYYFCRIFKLSMGESVMSYALKLRLQKASSNIINSEKSIIEIALDIGFETPNGFNKAFKKIFDMTPTEYRKKHNSLLLNYKEKRMNTPIITEREAIFVIYTTKFGDYEKSAVEAWDELVNKFDRKESFGILTNKELLGICHNDPDITSCEEIKYDAAISCTQEEALKYKELGFKTKKVQGGKFACLTYKGLGEEAKRSWKDLFAWIIENNLSKECKDLPPFEKYTNWVPGIKDENLIKEIYIPLN